MAKFGKKNKVSLDLSTYNICILGESGIGKTTLMKETCETLFGEDGYMIFNCIDIFRTGYYITNGRVTPIVWMKTSDTDITRYFGLDGQEITLNTGKTYIALCPNDDFPNLKIYP